MLETLKIPWCWHLTDASILVVAQHCRRLRLLDLTGVKLVSDAALEPLDSLLPRLRILSVKQCNRVTDRAVAALQRRTRGRADTNALVVINYYGSLIGGRRPSPLEFPDEAVLWADIDIMPWEEDD